jgi:hypothetical protein
MEATLIVGLHIDVPGSEIRDLLIKKAEHHALRHASYVRELANLETALGGVPMERQGFSSHPSDPRQSFRQKVKEHARQLKHTRFLAAHVVLDATYRLSVNELDRLGVQDEEEPF